MYGLKLPTDPRWVHLAEKTLEEILTDHAYCEQKAASTSISIIQNFPEYENVVDALIPIVTEEWGHFKMVIEHLKKRNLKLGRQRKDQYVNGLLNTLKKGGSRKEALVEKLLMSAMIEARSAERFKLLSQGIADEDLRKFYKNLMVSEAGHYRLFLDLALEVMPKDYVMPRWVKMLQDEAEILKQIELRGDRMH